MKRRLQRWLFDRYCRMEFKGKEPRMVITMRPLDPLFWLWLYWD